MSERSQQCLTRNPIDAATWRRGDVDPRDGASVEFLGMVRGSEGEIPISHLFYEAYEPMAEQLIGRWIEEATARWLLHRVDVLHCLGRVAVGEVAVLIRVEAPHRDQAFEACRFLIDAIKRDAPIWKTAYDRRGMVVGGSQVHEASTG